MKAASNSFTVFVVAFGICLFSFTSIAQPLRFYRYTINDGLSQSSIKSIVQDSTGFIWMATQDGLNRFDSKNFKVWKRNSNKASLSDNSLNQIILVNGKLWVGTNGGGINVYDPNTDSILWIRRDTSLTHSLPDNNVNSLLLTSSGDVWAGCDNGIAIIDTASFRVYYSIPYSLATPPIITSITEDGGKNIWAASRHDGVYIFQSSQKKRIAHLSKKELGLSTDRVDVVRHLRCDGDNKIWISTNRGLYKCELISGRLPLEKVKLTTASRDFSDEVVMCTMRDQSGKIWIGTQNGILVGRENNGLFNHYNQDINNPYSLSDRVILCIYEDVNQIVWIGTYNGINKHINTTSKFRSYKFDVRDHSRNLHVVRSIYTDDDTHIFVGTVNALCLFNLRSETVEYIRDADGKDLQNVFCIVKDTDSQLWVGNSNGFQRLINSQNGYKVEDATDHPELDIFENTEVTQCVAVSENLYLLATYNENGLYLWDTEKKSIGNFQSKSLSKGNLPDNRVNHIHRSKNGKIWIATNKGVSEFKPEEQFFVNYAPGQNGVSDPGYHQVNAIEDDGDLLWLATNRGLIQFDPVTQKALFFTENEGLANNTLYAVQMANDSILWMSSNKGLSEFNKRNHRFANYDVMDGLQSNEYNRYAWFRSSLGELYFGGMEGFDAINSSFYDSAKIPLVVTSIRIIDKSKFADLYPVKHPALKLRYSQNAIGFEYALLDFKSRGRGNYLCKLDGFDKEWINNGNNTFISYTNLEPGKYLFRVKLNDDSIASDALYSFTITAPYWKTTWFTLLIITLVLSLFGYIVRLYVSRKIEKQRLVFEKNQAVEHERTRIATDMHDDLGSGLSRIKFLSENIDIKTKQSLPVSDDISKIKEYSVEMIDKMGEIIWALNEKNDTLSHLLSYTRAYIAEYLNQNRIECTITAPDEFPVGFVSGEFRRNIFLTVKEALHNIVKHANASHVQINISIEEQLVIAIRDNGKGFDLNLMDHNRNGIDNMKKRMKDISGRLEIKEDHGTAILLSAPL